MPVKRAVGAVAVCLLSVGARTAAAALALLGRWRCWGAGAAGALALLGRWRCWGAGAAGALALLGPYMGAIYETHALALQVAVAYI
jgi:hypothetical protein